MIVYSLEYLLYKRLGFMFFRNTALSVEGPQYGSVLRLGQNRFISSTQLFKTDEGATTRKGPHIFFSCQRIESSENK